MFYRYVLDINKWWRYGIGTPNTGIRLSCRVGFGCWVIQAEKHSCHSPHFGEQCLTQKIVEPFLKTFWLLYKNHASTYQMNYACVSLILIMCGRRFAPESWMEWSGSVRQDDWGAPDINERKLQSGADWHNRIISWKIWWKSVLTNLFKLIAELEQKIAEVQPVSWGRIR